MKFLKNHIFVISAALIIGITILAFAINSTSSRHNNLNGVAAAMMPLQEEIRANGTVKAAEAVNLSFEIQGKILKVLAQTGDKVKANQQLVTLDGSILAVQITQAKADLDAQKAKLEEMQKGSRPEQIQVDQIKISNASSLADQAKKSTINSLEDAYTKADDAVRNKIDQFFTNPREASPQLNFSIEDFQLKINIESRRRIAENILESWQSDLNGLTASSNLEVALKTGNYNLDQIKSLLDNMALAVNSVKATASLSQGTLDGWKANVSGARGNINTANSNLSASQQSLETAESNLALANQQLVLDQSGATTEDIAAQQAQVERSEANVTFAQLQYAKTILVSPIDGIVTEQNAKVGAIVSPNQPIVSVISNAKYQIEVFVSETDIAKIKIGQPAETTLDAYGSNQPFDASVINIDPAATVINGSEAYKTTLQFNNDDDRIKAGMNANVKILTTKRDNAVAVPASAIITQGNDKFVLVEKNNSSKQTKVETGIYGNNGYVEIISGIEKGDVVATFGKTN